MKEINLPEFGRDIIRAKNNPAKLDSIQLTLAGWYANYAEKMIDLELAEATFWENNKDFNSEKPKSDPLVRALWKITKEGHEMIETERTLSTIHILISSIKASLNRQTNEMRMSPK
jgi:hypothetical protein